MIFALTEILKSEQKNIVPLDYERFHYHTNPKEIQSLFHMTEKTSMDFTSIYWKVTAMLCTAFD